MADTNPTSPEQFRECLKDVVAVCEKLATYSETTGELAEMCRLALANDGQLKVLMAIVFQGKR